MTENSFPLRTLFFVYIGLVCLLVLTVGASFFSLGPWSWLAGLGIASGKAALVGLYFMNLKKESPTIRILAMAGFLWVGLLFALTFSDYLTRFSFGTLGK